MATLKSTLTALKQIYETQRRFVLFGLLGIFLPLALWIVYACYAEGRIRAYGPVRITHNFMLITESPPSVTTTGASRWGSNNMHTSWRRKFHLWGKTSTGAQCFVDTDLLGKDRVTDQPRIAEGETITSWYFLHKERGDWCWTEEAGGLFVIFLLLFAAMTVYVLIKQRAVENNAHTESTRCYPG